MGGFFYASKKDGSDVSAVLKESRNQFELSGFSPPTTFETDAYKIDYYGKIEASVGNYVRFDSDNFIFAVGTFIYGGLIGTDALRLFYQQVNHRDALRTSRGHFVVVLRKNNQTYLLHDLLGAYQVFITRDGQCATTSFLAAIGAANACTINVQETYEYVFNGVTLGDSTLFAEVRRLSLFECMKLEPAPTIICEQIDICPEEQNAPFSKLVDHNLQGLLGYAADLVGLFGSNIKLALSGGYDSRLLLALFRHCGATPEIFVYGSKVDQDVTAARKITDLEGIKLHHVDKIQLRHVQPEEYADVVETNFYMEDALPSDGIFQSGAELIARRQRNEHDALHVNGGGGEVFRNFFYLPDRALTPRQFVWVFYSRFSAGQCSSTFDVRTYENGIAEKVTTLTKTRNGKLSRRQVECLYPYFRCRSWFGHENSINNRWGYSVLPFFDHPIVESALQIPVRYKYFGNFEGSMIRQADSSLARHLSNYGHNFLENAPFFVAAKELLTYFRPLWLRRNAFRIKSLRDKSRADQPLLSNRYIEQVIDTRFPHMSKFFNVPRVTSPLHFARICTLEYLFQHVSVR